MNDEKTLNFTGVEILLDFQFFPWKSIWKFQINIISQAMKGRKNFKYDKKSLF